jgi:hypothetical protein
MSFYGLEWLTQISAYRSCLYNNPVADLLYDVSCKGQPTTNIEKIDQGETHRERKEVALVGEKLPVDDEQKDDGLH